jgi:hypothetical protein
MIYSHAMPDHDDAAATAWEAYQKKGGAPRASKDKLN